MQFNEFQRMLQDSHLSEKAQYLLTHMFEVQVEISKSLDITLTLMEHLTDKLAGVTQVNSEILAQMRELKRRGMPDGVEVHSVRNEPEN